MTIPCPSKVDCPPAIPLLGFDSDEADANLFLGTGYAQPRQPLGQSWGEFGDVEPAQSALSQADADALAANAALQVALNPPAATPPAYPLPLPSTYTPGPLLDTENNVLLDTEGNPLLDI